MIEDNVYLTSQHFDARGCYERIFLDLKDTYLWYATVYNCGHRMFNDISNISSDINSERNPDGTFTIRFDCEGEANIISVSVSVSVGNIIRKFNVLFFHFGPSIEVSNNEVGYNSISFIKKNK